MAPRDSLEKLSDDLLECKLQCNIRGLNKGEAWASLLYSALPRDQEQPHETKIPSITVPDDYVSAKPIFDGREYDRAAHLSRNHRNQPLLRFIHFYSRYLATEKRRLDNMVDATVTIDKKSSRAFYSIRTDLERSLDTPDSWILYVHAIVLLKLDDRECAIDKLVESIKAEPLNWPSWHQLAVIIEKTRYDQLKSQLPNNWMRLFFDGIVFLELDMNEQAYEIYDGHDSIIKRFFSASEYVKTQIATVKHNLRDVDAAVEIFRDIRASDPFRLDKMDIYSNLLYINGKREELASLSHSMNEIDIFRVETNCCIANFYSMRSDHAKAVVYFSRALQLNPSHVSAFILMGHEYVELKNTDEAIKAYRAAVNINKRDYRAWYGLGQTYEILGRHKYCLDFYSRAQNLRPYDTRMIMALGDTYERLQRDTEAMKCFERAGGTGLFKWASLLEKNGRKEEAAEVYRKFVAWWNETNLNQTSGEKDSDLAHALKFLDN